MENHSEVNTNHFEINANYSEVNANYSAVNANYSGVNANYSEVIKAINWLEKLNKIIELNSSNFINQIKTEKKWTLKIKLKFLEKESVN
jgi:hypothetical protein